LLSLNTRGTSPGSVNTSRSIAVWVVSSLIALTLLMSGCGQTRSVMAAHVGSAPTLESFPHSREADDFARFIAGMPSNDGSPYAPLEASPVWQEHRRLVESAWQQADAERLSGMRQFQQTELNAGDLREQTVFYPFGGPDALTASLYFPHNPVLVIVGLEPAGTLPSAKDVGKKDLAAYLGGLRASTANAIGHSFFVTREMDRQYRGQITDGVLVPILDLLIRTGHSIQGYRYVRLDEQGRIADRPADYHAPGRIGNKGIDIEYRTDADQSTHRLLYFSVNLSDSRLRENPPFLSFVAGLKDVVTLLKATSYMPHHPEFSMIRDVILRQSTAVLQDDSGIPYRMFDAARWNVQLYGGYQQPYGSFRWLEQADLKHAYEATNPKELPMAIGYGYRRIPSNLQLARRK
jgi:hypothetical protein